MERATKDGETARFTKAIRPKRRFHEYDAPQIRTMLAGARSKYNEGCAGLRRPRGTGH
jgi:hypothetical protein